MHIVHTIANSQSVPYFNEFAERIGNYKGVKFSFVSLYPEPPQMLEDMRMRGCDCYWIKYDAAFRKTNMIIAFFRLYKLFRRLKPDVVNTHLFDDSMPALFAARLANVKIRVIHKQDTSFHWFYKPFWVWADKFNNCNATHIVAVSDESKKFIIEKEKAKASKLYRIHSGIDIKFITSQNENDKNELVNKYGLKDKLVIGTVARYIDWKGYRYIIEAARTVVPKYKQVKFLFIGTGSQRAELEKLAGQYGLKDNIIFTGWIDRKYMPSLFGVMDIYVHAAIMEPFGFAISEAMANGIPLVITKTGGAGDVLEHKKTCYFTDYRNPQSIADGIEWMLANKGIRENMRGQIMKLAREKFSVEGMLDGFMKLYKEAAGEEGNS